MTRLAELLATFSIATDHGMGFPAEHALRVAAVASRLATETGHVALARDAFHLALMRYAGCTADAHLAAAAFGDESTVRGALYGTDLASPRETIPRLARAVSRGRSPLRGVANVARALTRAPAVFESGRSHCEVADRLAERIGFDAPFRAALFQSFERWDGRGWTEGLRGDAIVPAMRIVHVADEIEHGHRVGGLDGAVRVVRARAQKTIDPALASAFVSRARAIAAVLDVPSAWTAALDAEPAPWREIDDDETDAVLFAIADFTDLKSRYTRGHSRTVARLAAAGARRLGLGDAEQTVLRAGLVHDVGRVAISAGIWDKRGLLTDDERERVRLHAYLGERILSRAPSLARIADVASAAHERLDGKGYHRRLSGGQCTAAARVLAAADVLAALGQARPHRPAFGPARAAEILGDMARRGELCPDATAALRESGAPPAERTSGDLTGRELEVLALLARGKTNKEIATELDVSVRTAGHHVEHIFGKLGVTTRAAAAVLAMQRGLVG